MNILKKTSFKFLVESIYICILKNNLNVNSHAIYYPHSKSPFEIRLIVCKNSAWRNI